MIGHTYANYINHTSSPILYAAAAAENILIFGLDVSNTFGEAKTPEQGFYIRPDSAFHDWWVHHKCREPIPPVHYIPVRWAM